MEKYKELYDLAISVHSEEMSRFNRLDQKASRYLSVFSILIAIVGSISKWLIEDFIPIEDYLSFFILVFFFLSIVVFIVGWYFSFRVLRNHNLIQTPMNDNIIHFYDNNNLINIYYTMTKGFAKAKSENTIINDKKSWSLGKSYYSILVGLGSLLMLFMLLFLSIIINKA